MPKAGGKNVTSIMDPAALQKINESVGRELMPVR